MDDKLQDLLIAETMKAYRDGYQAGFRAGLDEGKHEMITAVLAIIHADDEEKASNPLKDFGRDGIS